MARVFSLKLVGSRSGLQCESGLFVFSEGLTEGITVAPRP
jgi:hypothetical protein